MSTATKPKFFTTHIQRPFTNQERNAAGECLEDVRGLVVHTVRRYLPRGMDLDDAVANGYYHYLRAYESHGRRAAHMPFARWVRYCVRSGTLGTIKTDIRRAAEPLGTTDIADPRPAPDRAARLLEGLTEDARLVARLTLEAPAEIANVAAERGGTERNFRSALRDYLRGLGWAAARINESFDEIRTALTS